MSNMSYCKFQNTLDDLQDCIETLNNAGIYSPDDLPAREDLPNDEDGEPLMSLEEYRAAKQMMELIKDFTS